METNCWRWEQVKYQQDREKFHCREIVARSKNERKTGERKVQRSLNKFHSKLTSFSR